jgi:hypothetical protein
VNDVFQVWLAVGALTGVAVAKFLGGGASKAKKNVSTHSGPTTLHYFQGRGRAEGIRWMLAVCDIPFDEPAFVIIFILKYHTNVAGTICQGPPIAIGGPRSGLDENR